MSDDKKHPLARTRSMGPRIHGRTENLRAAHGPAKPFSGHVKTYGDPNMRRIHPRNGL